MTDPEPYVLSHAPKPYVRPDLALFAENPPLPDGEQYATGAQVRVLIDTEPSVWEWSLLWAREAIPWNTDNAADSSVYVVRRRKPATRTVKAWDLPDGRFTLADGNISCVTARYSTTEGKPQAVRLLFRDLLARSDDLIEIMDTEPEA